MTKETKLRAKLDRQIAKGSPKAHKTLDGLMDLVRDKPTIATYLGALNRSATMREMAERRSSPRDDVPDETDTLISKTVEESKAPLWDSPSMDKYKGAVETVIQEHLARVRSGGDARWFRGNEEIPAPVETSGLEAMARRDQCGRE